MMRASRYLFTGSLCILIAASVALSAQDEKREPQAPQRQEEPRTDAHPEANPGQMNAPRQQEEAKPSKQEKNEQKVEKNQQKEEQKQQHEQMKADHQMNNASAGQTHARPAGKSAHIPDDKFHSSFGRSHTFVVQRPVVVQGQQGFVYGGYSFVFVDPWPADWAFTDDCYVDYIDGEYFLFDVLHPGIRIALFVVVV